MEIVLSLAVSILFATGFFQLMDSGILRMIFGFLLISQAANLFLFSVGGITRGRIPILLEENIRNTDLIPEPLSQALILTAIVIGFAVTAFLVVLARQTARSFEAEDSDQFQEAEK